MTTNRQAMTEKLLELVISIRLAPIPRQTGRLTVGRNITSIREFSSFVSYSVVEELRRQFSVQLWIVNQWTTEAEELTDS
jgi:hypothetical protein